MITNLHSSIKAQANLTHRHNEAWELMNRYYNKYQETKNATDLQFSQTYLQVGLNLQEYVSV